MTSNLPTIALKTWIKLKIKLTSAYGFEGGVSFAPDGKLFAYYAYYPSDKDAIDKYAEQIGKGFTDVSKSNIYIYHFDSKKSIQVGYKMLAFSTRY